ncbi:hypothetical protein FJT64_026304 [Amphibalanus amphitrite]|uniref:Uncharacterized protein n=1 Tax=Amphibalanus amphitrite TaxID=1232801 RepID=A0A6A4W213_AMPAM|nr:hypothetical protein FJT64_026304 [Amphibalanus amphitrite]
MKVFVALFATLACASAGLVVPATTVLRAPAHDSAVIQSHRFGGNFAYRTDEAHAYAAVSPVVSTVRKAVGVSYSHGAPIVKSTTVEHPVTYAAAPAVTYAGVPHAYGYAAPHAYGYAAPYGYGYAGLGLPLTFEKVEEAKAEPAVEAAE